MTIKDLRNTYFPGMVPMHREWHGYIPLVRYLLPEEKDKIRNDVWSVGKSIKCYVGGLCLITKIIDRTFII